MFHVTLLLLLVVPAVAEPEASRLVRQLGSSSYAEREAATIALRALGEQAIPALKLALASPDPEVKRRVSGLLKPLEAKVRRRTIDEIKQSKLTPVEKGRRLKAFITRGMSKRTVKGMLGNGKILLDYQDMNRVHQLCIAFERYELQVWFVKYPVEEGFWADEVWVLSDTLLKRQ